MIHLNGVSFLCIAVCFFQTGLMISCPKRNIYLNIDGSCDTYVECRNFTPNEKLCPDGLNFNQNTKWPDYPCGYPEEVPCVGRTLSESANHTAECPRQFGFFPSRNDNGDNMCGKYRMCVEGKSVEMECPPGLVFNPDTARCNWPEQVPSCKADNDIGFKCPPSEDDGSGNPVVSNHRYGGDCVYFVSCQNGTARVLSCDAGLAFNGETGRCEDADDMPCGDTSANSALI